MHVSLFSVFTGKGGGGEEAYHFIDENPSIFKHVLNVLRDINYPFPVEFVYRLTFYGINPSLLSQPPLKLKYVEKALTTAISTTEKKNQRECVSNVFNENFGLLALGC